ncbi:MAG: Octanoyltransferase LipM [Chlamydiae bacterium]|nr:Octanoyltransferase LipM [Chlamydiota bacterium]
MEITILDTGKNSAQENMALDKKLLSELDPDQLPILHLYDWEKPSATYGHFAKPSLLLNMQGVEDLGLDLAKRVTGGGVTFHFCDYAFSFLMPSHHPKFSNNTLENYRFVNKFVYQSVVELIEEQEGLNFLEEESPSEKNEALNFCMAKATKYDVLYQGKKIGGAAQRKTMRGYLHHGTISVAMPDSKYLKSILKFEDTFEAIHQNTHYFVENHLNIEKVASFRKKIQQNLVIALLKF